jgi:hypothetical protein
MDSLLSSRYEPQVFEIVRKVFRLACQGMGVTAIAEQLTEEKVLIPSAYTAKYFPENCRNRSFSDPYRWNANTIGHILDRQEYLGHTVLDKSICENFKTKQRPDQKVVDQKSDVKKAQAKAAAVAASAPKKVKLSYKDQRELEQLPAEMEKLEKEQAELSAKLADGSWFVSDANAATLASQRLAEIEESLLEKLERWDILENMSKGN